MRGGTGTAVVLALLAAACAWWSATGGGPPEPVPSIEPTPIAAGTPSSAPGPLPSRSPDPVVAPSADPAAEVESRMAELGSGPTDGPPRGHVRSGYREMPESLRAELREDARKKLDPLLAEFRAAGPGPGRAAILERMMEPLKTLMATGGGFEHLALLRESAENGATRQERKNAVIATHTLWQAEVVDWLEERARSPHEEVRFYAVEGFAWTEGEERPRALENLVRGLEDPAFQVRCIAALCLGSVVADPAHVPALLARLGREEDPRAVRTIVKAVLRLDPEDGADRVRTAAPGASGEAWAAAEEALR